MYFNHFQILWALVITVFKNFIHSCYIKVLLYLKSGSIFNGRHYSPIHFSFTGIGWNLNFIGTALLQYICLHASHELCTVGCLAYSKVQHGFSVQSVSLSTLWLVVMENPCLLRYVDPKGRSTHTALSLMFWYSALTPRFLEETCCCF